MKSLPGHKGLPAWFLYLAQQLSFCAKLLFCPFQLDEECRCFRDFAEHRCVWMPKYIAYMSIVGLSWPVKLVLTHGML